jgi:hypothetical protein
MELIKVAKIWQAASADDTIDLFLRFSLCIWM